MPAKKSAIGADDRLEARRVVGAREGQVFPEDALARAGTAHNRSNSAGGTARTTWCGQLSMATAVPEAPRARQMASTRCSVGGDGDQAGLGQVAGGLEVAKDRAEPAELLLESAVGREDTRGGKGQQLAAAVADHGVGPKLEPGQELIHGPLGVQDDVHRRRRRPELVVAFLGAGRKGARWAERHRPRRGRCGRRCRRGGARRESGYRGRRACPGYCEPSPGNRNARLPAPD